MTDKNLIEDSGTGLAQQSDRDWLDAAHLDAASHFGNSYGGIITGLGLTPNYTAPDVDVASGMAKVVVTNVSSIDHGDGQTTSWPEVSITVNKDAVTGLSLTDAAVNEIFLTVDLANGPDANSIVASTSGAPADPHIKIGEVDTSADTTTDQWGLISDSGVLTYPDQAAADDAETNLTEGTLVFVRDSNDLQQVQ